jgi:hypothetical protein
MKTCSVENCENPVTAKDLCVPHYKRWRKHGDVRADVPLQTRCVGFCAVAGCGRPMQGHGLCASHRRQVRKGKALADLKPIVCNRAPAGNGTIDHKGYRKIYRPDHPNAFPSSGKIPEHVFVMSEYLGRPLREGETVHHRNGRRADNRIENLELWTSNHPAGQRVEDVLAWATEIIALYGPEHF